MVVMAGVVVFVRQSEVSTPVVGAATSNEQDLQTALALSQEDETLEKQEAIALDHAIKASSRHAQPKHTEDSPLTFRVLHPNGRNETFICYAENGEQ